MKLSPHFTLAELTASQSASRLKIDNTPDDTIIANLTGLCVHILEPLRAHFGKPVVVSSGYRCPKLNKAVGGASSSQHVLGQAADITVPGIADYAVAAWLAKNTPIDQVILEFPPDGWVHVSYGPRNRRQKLTARRVKSFGRLKTVYLDGLHP